MTTMSKAKKSIGIDPAYDIASPTINEVEQATAIFLAACQSRVCEDMQNDTALKCALAEVWHAAKQYAAQHPQKLYKLGWY